MQLETPAQQVESAGSIQFNKTVPLLIIGSNDWYIGNLQMVLLLLLAGYRNCSVIDKYHPAAKNKVVEGMPMAWS